MNECWNMRVHKSMSAPLLPVRLDICILLYLLVCYVIGHRYKLCFGASICHLGSNVMFYDVLCKYVLHLWFV